jgi:hypothetical protein
MTVVETLVDGSVMTVRLVLPGTITEPSRGPAVCLSGKSGQRREIEGIRLLNSMFVVPFTSITDSRSFPPKNVTSYNDAKGSVPSSRPPWEEQSRNSPPASSAGTRYSQPASTYRSKEPPRSNPNVVYSRPPVPRDSVQPSLATRGSSPPPRRGYEAPSSASGRSVAPPRDYAYGGPTASAPEPHVANRSTYDRYGAPTPPADAYRNDSRGSDYRAPPPVGPPSGRPYPSAGLPPVAVDPYAHPSYDRQPPQYDR